MTRRRFFCVALLGLCGALGGVPFLLYDFAHADVLGGPLPAPSPPEDTIQLTPVEKLGKLMLYDTTLSNPVGYACATCHVAEAGYTGPNSEINAFSGPLPGVVPGRYSDRKPQSYLYAAFSPEGPYYDPGLHAWLGAISGMFAFPTSPSRRSSRRSTRTRWPTLLRGHIRPLSVGIHRSSFRSWRTDHIPHFSSRCTARMPSKSTLQSRSTNSSVRRSLPISPREQSARSVRSTMLPSTVRRRRTCTHSLHPKNVGANCTLGRANAFNATPPRQYQQYKQPRGERTHSPCSAMRTSASPRISITLTTNRPTRNPIPTDTIHSGLSTSITVSVPTPIRHPTGRDSTRMFLATFPSSAVSSRRRVCAAWTNGHRQIS